MKNDNFKLRTRNLRKTYGSVVALADASIEMVEGEFLTLLGPSGSGKTTMLMAIAGLNDPDAGEIWIDGKQATYLPPFQRDIGMVFQNYALFPHMTIFENIAFPLKMRKMSDADIKTNVGRVLETVQLSHVADRLPKELSGGQQQRIALARAFVYEPSIILMDEPLGALDKKLRDHLQLEIKHLHEQLGITVLYVTHDQEEAMVMSDRICLMNNARIEQLGTPDDLYFRPQTEFAADFLGESNMIECVVKTSTSKQISATGPDGTVFKALPNDQLNKGDACKLMVRPECMALLGARGKADNVVTATLTETIITGAVTKTYARLANDHQITATQLTTGPLTGTGKGGSIKFGWPADRTVALSVGTGADA